MTGNPRNRSRIKVPQQPTHALVFVALATHGVCNDKAIRNFLVKHNVVLLLLRKLRSVTRACI
jgi:hypothetical protein